MKKGSILFKTGTMLFALVMLLASCSSIPKIEDTSLVIAHTNDTHGRILEGKYDGMGFAKISTEVMKLRDENPNVLLLDAGDTFHGTTLVTLSKGEAAVKILNAMGYDAMTPGNHDFNYGKDRLLELAAMCEFPVVCANVIDDATGETILPPYTIIDVNGLLVGIFGLTTDETLYKTHPKNVEGLTFRDPAVVAQEMVDELRDEVHVLIALGHLGVDDETINTSTSVMEKVMGIDLFVDGHSHTPMEEGIAAGSGLIVQSGYHDKNLGIAKVNYSMEMGIKSEAMLFTKEASADVIDDAAILSLVEGINAENEKVTSVVVTKSDVLLDGERANVRTGSTNLGDLIGAALLDATEADISLQNGGGIRTSIEAGDVTKGEIISVLPFGNTVTVLEITGQGVIEVIENGVKAYPEASGGYCHMAGLTFEFDETKPAGSRVTKVMVAGKELDPSAKYSLATNDFLAAGGDQYEMLIGLKVLAEMGTLDDILVAYMNK
ncbi:MULTISPECIES: bifunctional UDP-sugar hydrolase/5'-nucleotidase [unclassified Oceanispirochaeta]|uniref:bifunctional metallophosphatase/5'-nucleotidase n=1 Tax=unclassified Oceanispirochaeta TaxID=2635722 RepID=UPI000E09A34C|nr:MULTISPECIES: bifunctional UDP-sugar hydrolase/5'-nucleotidase [unclassified Oceanispirochaeta]MBF9016256.1 bifunctional metallophosphatase/5'-nucleotidase [Oceanispirochaeta sp. M2]NPD72718.1 bifunctional metallophosphatase/5'-nucleotidase [Oceanispirochaeta sp. M1]RDG31865.1 bifunctional metallophosphatase/5'-nucleotidase [Oceanispirochaeta sp. M1]